MSALPVRSRNASDASPVWNPARTVPGSVPGRRRSQVGLVRRYVRQGWCLPGSAGGDLVAAESEACHRQRTHRIAIDEDSGALLSGVGQAGDVEQGDEMIGCGNGQRVVAVVDDRQDVTGRARS